MNGRAPKRPREPGPSDCCGNGCSRCVWDVYFDDLVKYEEYVQDQKLKGRELEDDHDGMESSSSSEEDNDEVHNFVGSVVIKYVEGPTSEEKIVTPLVAVRKLLGSFSPITDVNMILSSSSQLTNSNDRKKGEEQGIQIVDVTLGDKIESDEPGIPVIPSSGDVVEIFIPNDYDLNGSGHYGEVEKLCDRLQLEPNRWCELHRSPFVPPTHFPPWLPLHRPIQIRTLLAYFVDISSCSYLLRPAFFQTLLRLATSSKTRPAVANAQKEGVGSIELLEACASKDVVPFIYKKIINGELSLCYPRLIDMLNVFPFVDIPIERLLEITGPLRPRRFSVSNYTVDDSSLSKRLSSVQICLRRVDVSRVISDDMENNKGDVAHVLARCLRIAASNRCSKNSINCTGGKGYVFKGHISNPLCNFRSLPRTHLPMYVGTKLFGTTLFTKGLKEALLPFSTQTGVSTTLPLLILVGVGTGISPLMSVVNELVMYRQSAMRTRIPDSNCWVVYGARDFSELVYHRELREALEKNAISRYDISISRSNEQGYPKYVTDVLDSHAEKLRYALLEQNARLFACGPIGVLKSLRQRLMNHILAFNDDDESMREQRVLYLERKGQIMFDVWGAVNTFE